MIKKEDIKVGMLFLLPCERIERTEEGFSYYVNTKNGYYFALSKPTDVFRVKSVKNGLAYCDVRDITNVQVNLDILQKNGLFPEYAEKAMDGWADFMGKQSEKSEQVNHPYHYAWLKDLCGVEPIDICRNFGFSIGNALKYLMRKGKADGDKTEEEKRIEDLRKAIFYINDEIERIEGKRF